MIRSRVSLSGILRPARFALSVFLLLVTSGAAIQAQNYTDLYDFGTHKNDPHYLDGFLAQGMDGALYGTSTEGGKFQLGAIFKISPNGRRQTLYSFDGTLGTCHSGLTLGTDGNFYGTTDGADSGQPPFGTVFRITPNGDFTVLHTFANQSDAGYPHAPPVQGLDGNFYGTTGFGGPLTFGTVYRMTPSGLLTTIYQFDSVHGASPTAPLVQASNGNFYGVTMAGGTHDHGTVFRITPHGKLKVLYNFDETHGAEPFAPLIEGSDGLLYGTTIDSGQHGLIYKIAPGRDLLILHNLNGSSDGSGLYAGLVEATDGKFYGAAYEGGSLGLGTLFKINHVGGFTVLHDFDGVTGANGLMTLVQHTNGKLYGTAYVGGAFGYGAFYRLNVGLGPFVKLVSNTGRVGKSITILGEGLQGTADVSFNGIPADYTIVSDTNLKATVPEGATSGPVTVTTSAGLRTSNRNFRVIP